jgi:hypothetical protein
MYVVNESKFDNAALNPLVQFVLTQMPVVSQFAWLHMLNGEPPFDPMEVTGGLAEANVPFPSDPAVPHRVTMWLRFDNSKYPYHTCHRKRVGGITVQSWEEEFILVFAHEMRHVHQFLFGSPRHYEVDAERCALAVLNHYRNQKAKRAA